MRCIHGHLVAREIGDEAGFSGKWMKIKGGLLGKRCHFFYGNRRMPRLSVPLQVESGPLPEM